MSVLKVAVVGCGYWAGNVVRTLMELRDVQVVTLCDIERSRAQAMADRFAVPARVASDHRELAQDSNVDAAFVVTPVRTHYEIARDFLRTGKHVFVEKPLAATVREGEELERLARSRGVTLMVGHVFEYSPAVRYIKDYLSSGDLGRLLYVYSQRVNLGRIQTDISALWSFAPHDVSILNYWLDAEPLRVSAQGLHCLGQEVEDVVFVLLEYPDGVGVHLHLGWIDPRKIRQMTLVGTRKMLVYDDVSVESRIQIYDKGINRLDELVQNQSFAHFQSEIRMGDIVIPYIPFAEPLQEECRHFIECVRSGARPRTDAESGLRVVRALQAAQRSLDLGGVPVALSEVGTGLTGAEGR